MVRPMPQIFISAMPQDQVIVDEIRLTLQKSYDDLRITLATTANAAEMNAAIARSDLVIYLASPQAQTSPQRQAELVEAVRLNKPLQTIIVRGDSRAVSRTRREAASEPESVESPVFDLTSGQGSNKALFGFYSAVNRVLQPKPIVPPAEVSAPSGESSQSPTDDVFFSDLADDDEIEELADTVKKAEAPSRSTNAPLPPPAPSMPAPRPAPARPVTKPAAPTRSRSRLPLLIIALIASIIVIVMIGLMLTNQNAPLDARTVMPTLQDTNVAEATGDSTSTPQPSASATGQMTATPIPGNNLTPPDTVNMTILLVVSLVILAVLGGAAVLWLNRTRTAALSQTKDDPPLVFISYRRDPSWGQARCITNSLKDRHINVFFDVDSIDEGKFAEVIKRAIENCDYFVPILAPVTLESEWVQQEIVYALQLQKPIIPLLVDGFRFDDNTLPPAVSEISTHNAINVTHEFYDAAIERLTTRFIHAS